MDYYFDRIDIARPPFYRRLAVFNRSLINIDVLEILLDLRAPNRRAVLRSGLVFGDIKALIGHLLPLVDVYIRTYLRADRYSPFLQMDDVFATRSCA
jgi:hypothetical protein